MRSPTSAARSRRGAPVAVVAVLAAVLLTLAACGGSDTSAPADPVSSSAGAPTSSATGTATGSGPQYVALGDSYSAAPGLPPQDTSSGSCQRSLEDYPHLVAAAQPGIQLDDRTCSGATSDDLLSQQAPALSADTDYVTFSIGGNDQNLFSLVVGACAQLYGQDPTGSPCTDAAGARLAPILASIRTGVTSALRTVRTDAPNATIIVVGYPQVLPSDGTTCPDLVPIASGDFALVNRMNKGLSDNLRAAAKAVGADFVDVYGASKGHDICSESPWINGITTAPNGVIPFHPFAAEQEAVARLIVQTVS